MKKTIKKVASSIGATAVVSFTAVTQAHAQKFGPFQQDFSKTLKTVFTFVFGAAGVIFVILFLVGGVQYLTSAGNEEASTKAKKLLIDAVVGLVIVVVSYAAANWIVQGLGGSIDTNAIS